jgi:isoleucyl-tRNA synthetase
MPSFAMSRWRSSAPDAAKILVLAADLKDACLQRYGLTQLEQLAEFTGRALERLQLSHPWLPRKVPVILGEHVTLEAGTGAVHTAPAHGQEDYVVGLRYQLPVVNPVGPDGRFLPETPLVAGLRVDKAEAVIIAQLIESGHAAASAAAASQLSALLAPQITADLSCHAAMVHQHGQAGIARAHIARHQERAMDAGVG